MSIAPVPDWDDLDDFLAEPIPADLELVPDPETIDEELAGRMLRRAALIRAEADRVVARCTAEQARIKEWHDARMASIESQLAWIDRSLEGFMRRRNMEDPKCKTVTLPNGKLSLRAPRPRIEVTDETAFTTWAFDNASELIRIKMTADKTELAKLESGDSVDDTPEAFHIDYREDPEITTAVPGVVRVIPTESTFSYEVTA